MTDNTNNEVPEISEITPLPTPPVGMPRVPITLFNVWTWSTPVIPSFYWNVYSAEQRIKQICKEIGRIEAYLDYAATTANEAHLDMINHINEVEQKLSKQIADLTVRLTTEVNRLDALISAETAAREAGDEKLEAEIVKETTERKAADAKLTADLETEVQDRQDADEGLHSEISTETTARIHADDVLHSEISAETAAREEADTAAAASITQEVADRKAADDALGKRIDAADAEDAKLEAGLATKLERNDLKASGKITLTPGEGNMVTIGDTFEADFDALQNAITGLQASLASETDERRADDSKLWAAVNNRIERGKILAGEGISVVNDPDSTTVTISATGSADIDEIRAKAEAAKTTADAAKTAAEAAQRTADGKLSTVSVGRGLTGEGTLLNPVELREADAAHLGGVRVGAGLYTDEEDRLSVDLSHDYTLHGSGRPRNPLGVVAAPQGALTAGEQGLAVNAGEGLSISGGKLVAEVTQAKLDAVDSKATTAASTASEAKSTAEAAQATATSAESKAEAASTAATEAKNAVNSKLSSVAHGETLTGDGTASSPLEVRTATEGEAGVLTEARVRELGASGITEVAHDESLDGNGTPDRPLSLAVGTREHIGGVKEADDGSIKIWSDGHLIPNTVTEDTSDPAEIGMVSQNAIKWIASEIADEQHGLEKTANVIGLKVSSVFGFTSDGSLALSDSKLWSDEAVEELNEDLLAGKPRSIQSIGEGSGTKTFYLSTAKFYVKRTASSPWEDAEAGTFELYTLGDLEGGTLYFRCTPYGRSVYGDLTGGSVKCVYSALALPVQAHEGD